MTIQWYGAINSAIANDAERTALYQTLFNKVIAAWEAKSVTLDFFTMKSAVNGQKAESFILLDDVKLSDLDYDVDPTTGNFTATVSNQAEKVITVDANFTWFSKERKMSDTNLSHYDVQAQMEKSALNKFDLTQDLKNFISVAKGSEASHPTTGQLGGVKVIDADFATNLTSTLDTLDTIITTIEDRSMVVEEFRAFVTPGFFNWFRRAAKDILIDKDLVDGVTGLNKNVSAIEYNGLTIVKSASFTNFIKNHTGVAGNTRYAYNALTSLMLVAHPASVGTLAVPGIRMAYFDNIANNGTEKFTMLKQDGVDWLNPQTCYQVVSA